MSLLDRIKFSIGEIKFIRSLIMAFTNIVPPESVRGIQQLTKQEKELFNKKILVPCVRVRCRLIGEVLEQNVVKTCAITRCSNKLKPTVDLPGNSTDRYVLFDPEKLTEEKKQDVLDAVGRVVGTTPQFHRYSCNIGYVDWTAKKCISAVLPEGLIFSGFTQAGHIVHLNLREELLPYKYVIGNILRDKISQCRTVVNKLDLIASEFRTFELDHLAGDPDYVTTVNVDRMLYKIDFSKTFWNTRLSSEHRRIWMQFDKNSIVFDCCAGVGPFVLPAARIRIRGIYANDLNPDCVRFLRENIRVNKLTNVPNFSVHNMDAVAFINEVMSETLISEANQYDKLRAESSQDPELQVQAEDKKEDPSAVTSRVHILMNLPAKSLSFLPHFRGFLRNKLPTTSNRKILPFPVIVHCHTFVKAEDDVPNQWYSSQGQKLVRNSLGVKTLKIIDIHFVRKVAGRKWMLCISFELPGQVMFSDLPAENFTTVECTSSTELLSTPESQKSASAESPNTSGSSISMDFHEGVNSPQLDGGSHSGPGISALPTASQQAYGNLFAQPKTSKGEGSNPQTDSPLKRLFCEDRNAFLCEEELLETEPKAKKDKSQ